MRMLEKIVSDCCGDEVEGYDFCRCCLEHCTPILEVYPDPTDPENVQPKFDLKKQMNISYFDRQPIRGVAGAEKVWQILSK